MRSMSYFLATASACVVGLPALAHAQEPVPASYGDIIVTAQKRNERLQDVPLAVSAVDSDSISKRGLTNIAQISTMVPNVKIDEGIVNPTLITPFIRGIGTIDNGPEVDMPIAISIDGVYLASVYGGLIDAFDIQQVEVLRGPQGTLQGRNAPGGSVNIITRRPGDEWVVRAMVEYGKFDDIKANVGIDGPLIEDKLGIKLAALYRNAKGFQKALDINEMPTGARFGGRDTVSFKGGLEITPTDSIDIWLSGDYTKDTSPPTAFRDANDNIAYPRPEYADELVAVACSAFGWCTPAKKYTTHQFNFGDNYVTNWALSSNINIDTGPMTFTSVTGFRKIRDTNQLDIDATPYPLLETHPTTVRQKSFSQEIRLASNDDGALSAGGLLRWVVGAYYMHSKMYRDQSLFALGNSIGADYGQTLKSHALFGHLDIMPTDQLTFSVGARESWDKKYFRNDTLCAAGVNPCEGTAKWKKFMFDLGANYKFTPDIMAYVRFARGSRPGGWNQSLVTYDLENVDSYEGGLKTNLFNRKVTFNVTGFYYKYKDIQRQTSIAFDDDGDGNPDRFSRVTSNAGASHAWGAEVELTARPIEGLQFNFGLGYLKAQYDSWDDFEVIGGALVAIDNSTLPVFRAPRWTVNVGGSYDIPVSDGGLIETVTPLVNLYHISSHYTNTEAQPVSYENGYSLLSAALRFAGPDDKYAVTFFGENLLNDYYIQNGGTLGGLSKYVQEGRPRTYGVRLEVQFK